MKTAKAFAHANISCIFRIHEHKNPRWMGSSGVGFTVNEGVVVSVKATNNEKNIIKFSNKKIIFPTVESIIKKLNKNNENFEINIESKLPLGCGFGLSGASALATAYALNKLLNLKKNQKELAIIAHTAEAENKTGLGDVVNQFYGGFCVKSKPSSHFIVKRLNINGINVYCKYFGRISTKSIITNPKLKNKINKSASIALNKIKNLNNKNIKFKDIIKISKGFAVGSGLLKDKNTIEAIKNIEKNKGNASMIMLGNAVFSDKYFKGAIKLKISDKKACLL